MKLFVRSFSPYARMTRAVVLEKRLGPRIETIEAQTRIPGSSYYSLNPSGRVPFLLNDDGVGFEGSALICAFLDHLDGRPVLHPRAPANDWELGRAEAVFRSFLDGLTVWARERNRAASEQSATTLAHEGARAERLADAIGAMVPGSVLDGEFNMAQLTLVAALDFATIFLKWDWQTRRPDLADWNRRLRQRESIALTTPSAD